LRWMTLRAPAGHHVGAGSAVIDESFRQTLVDLGVFGNSIQHVPNFTRVTASVLSREAACRELGFAVRLLEDSDDIDG